MTAPTKRRADLPAAPRRGWNVTLWVLQVVAAAWMLLAALGKFTGAPQITATFDAIGVGDWFRYLIAVLEVAGAVALFVPRLTRLAALAFVALMIGAAVTHLVVGGGGVAVPLAFLVVCAVIAWGRRRSTAHLWQRVARVTSADNPPCRTRAAR